MTMLYSRDQILEGLILDVADCLAIEPTDVELESPVFAGDSLGVLDITFRIQKRFGIRIQLHSLMESWEVDSNGNLASTTIQKLNADFPQIDWPTRLAAIPANAPLDLLTVGLLAEMVFDLQTRDPSNSTTAQISHSS